jgi:hypothetical protein
LGLARPTRRVWCREPIPSAAGRSNSRGDHGLTVRRSRTGRGLFSSRPIKKREHASSKIPGGSSPKPSATRAGVNTFAINDREFMDGWVKGNIARFINHSCRSNCGVEIPCGRIYILAAQPIRANEELTFDYGDEYFEDRVRPHGCKWVACFPSARSAASTSSVDGRRT